MLPKSIRKLLTLIVAVIVGLILLRLLEQPQQVGASPQMIRQASAA